MADKEVLDPAKKSEFLDTSRQRFQLTVEAEASNRKLALEDDRFRNLEHWPQEIKQQRKDSGRPCLVIDKLSQPIRQVTNAERQARPAIQINPVSGGANRATAEMQQGLIRQIEAHSYADVAYDWAFDGAVAHGWGYFRVLTDYESESSFDQVIKIAWIEDPYSVYMDPTARSWNKSDARWAHVIEDLTKENYDARYGSRTGAQKAVSLQSFSGLGNQAPAWFPDGRVRIAEYFYVAEVEDELVQLSTGQALSASQLNGTLPPGVTILNRRPVKRRVVKWCLHNALETIEKREWAGKFIPIIEVEGERLYIEGKRIKRGLIRAAQDPQRMYDYWVSAATETTALAPRAPYVMYEGQDEGYEKMWELANVQPFSSLKVRATTKPTGNQILPLPQRTAIEPPIQAMMIGVKQAELDIHSSTAFYDASDPRRANAEQSGKAVLARQAQGQQTNQNFLDNLARSLRYLGEILLDLMPKIYDRPGRVVQILGMDDEVKSVMLGQPFQRDQQGQPQPVDPAMEAAAGELQQGMAEFYDLSQGQYAVTVTVGNSFTTRRQEAVASMLQLVEAQPAIAPLIGDVLVENMDWPGAPKLAARLKKMLPPQLQEGQEGQPNAQQLQQQLAQLGQQHQALTQIVEQQSEQLKGNQLEVQAKERIAAADRESKERIAAIQAQTQLVIAQQKISADQALAGMQAQLDATIASMEAGTAEAQQMRDLESTETQQMRDLSSTEAQQSADLDAQDRQQGQDLAFQAQQVQTAAQAPEAP